MSDRSTFAGEKPDSHFIGDPPAAFDKTALPDRRELALVAVERTRMPMVVTDPRQKDCPIVLANQAFLDLTGYSADEVIGRNCRFLQGPMTSAEDVSEIRRALRANEDHIDVELLNYRKDGSSFWCQLAISPVYDEDGVLIYYFGSQKDVTERRRARELEVTERLLLMEVDHRAMNALALVQSIMRLSQANDVASYAQTVSGRVDAISRAHRMLGDSGWTAAKFSDLVVMETGALSDAPIILDGPDELIAARLVQPLTLVLHELMTNALKHGALSRPSGRISLNWQVIDDHLDIAWSEDGAGKIEHNDREGLGLRLVKSLIERQLGGKFATEWRDVGVEARITLPHTDALPPNGQDALR
jgi:PAS domain S-box-containing protein